MIKITTPKIHNESHSELRKNPLLGDLTYEFSSEALKKHGLNAVSFCFFVNWNSDFSSGTLDPHIWIKKELTVTDGSAVNVNDGSFLDAFLLNEPLENVRKKTSFFSGYSLNMAYTIIKKLPIQQIPNEQNVIAELSLDETGIRKKLINYRELKELLVSYSGRAFRMGKSLNYYETELEKILSTDTSGDSAPFPGDCDLLLYDDNMKCKAVIEFKKRTSYGASVSIANQSISNYMDNDRLKYNRLNILRSYLESHDNSQIPLLVVYYSVAGDSDDNKIKIEAVSHDITSDGTDCFKLPDFCDAGISHSAILEHILPFID